MGKFSLTLLTLLILLMLAAVAAYQFGGPWALAGVIVTLTLLLAVAPKVIGALIFRGLRKAMEASGAALRGATVEVHSVQPEDDPPPDDDDGDAYERNQDGSDENHELLDPDLADLFYDGPRNWYSVDLTVQPAMRSDGLPTEYQPWSPHMLMLLGPPKELAGQLGPMAAITGMADGVCDIRKVEIWRDGVWVTGEHEDDEGPQRLRLLAGVKPGESRLRVGYVAEILGEVDLPDHPGR